MNVADSNRVAAALEDLDYTPTNLPNQADVIGGVSLEDKDDVLASVFSESVGSRLSFKSAAASYLEYASQRKRESTLRTDAQRLRTTGDRRYRM